MSIDTTIIAQDYVNVFELFDVARAAAKVESLGYTTWLDGTVRTLQTHPGSNAEQIIQRCDASGRPPSACAGAGREPASCGSSATGSPAEH